MFHGLDGGRWAMWICFMGVVHGLNRGLICGLAFVGVDLIGILCGLSWLGCCWEWRCGSNLICGVCWFGQIEGRNFDVLFMQRMSSNEGSLFVLFFRFRVVNIESLCIMVFKDRRIFGYRTVGQFSATSACLLLLALPARRARVPLPISKHRATRRGGPPHVHRATPSESHWIL